ncbi:hypothetical protein M408DRAFT_330031 [Serendipita vermifera MAFF 305830]|uniref:Secreted protein n=1 Tax=Serendipita vermifera MAFF 305830 TaxID=933852 RepID=A0A0C2WMX6_SERVB|nr:hypothetical protein M408DRAFT_330031 [Serendipita vermifera MAFF 305830]
MSYFRLTNRNRRTIVTALFGLTFLASVATVSASDVLPCPVRPSRHSFADSGEPSDEQALPSQITRMSRPRHRWIEERIPPKTV